MYIPDFVCDIFRLAIHIYEISDIESNKTGRRIQPACLSYFSVVYSRPFMIRIPLFTVSVPTSTCSFLISHLPLALSILYLTLCLAWSSLIYALPWGTVAPLNLVILHIIPADIFIEPWEKMVDRYWDS